MQDMQETHVQSLGQEDPLEEIMATHTSILDWRGPWTEEPAGLQSIELQRSGYNWSDLALKIILQLSELSFSLHLTLEIVHNCPLTPNSIAWHSKEVCESHLVVSNSLQPHGLYSPWNSPDQNTRVGSLSLLQGIFPTQGLNPGLLHCGRILYQLSHQGSPRILEWVAYAFSSGSSWPKNQIGVSCIEGRFFTSWATTEAIVWHT